MSDPHMPFLRAIIAAPGDDLPRLIYADWLDECGDAARAEFIRVQCELARKTIPVPVGWTPERSGCQEPNCRVCAFRLREAELLEANIPGDLCSYRTLWAGRAASLPPRGNYEFRRGFVEEVACTWADWSAHADAIRQLTPLRRVTLTAPSEPAWLGRALLSGLVVSPDVATVVTEGGQTVVVVHVHDPERFVRAALDNQWPGLEWDLSSLDMSAER